MTARPFWFWCVFPAVTMSLGWGLRGSIGGGPLGAMIPGAMIGLALCLLLGRESDAGRIAAFAAIGVGFGGQETYGQTVGLSLQPETFWWAILGFAVKGAVWGLLGGALIGAALARIDARRVIVGLALMVLGTWIGWKLIDDPKLIYFSNRLDKPREEVWAGLWLGGLLMLGWLRHRVPWWFALAGAIGGGVGFAFGASLQPWGKHVWPAMPLGWWKGMELTFGALLGLAYGVCAWRLRLQLRVTEKRSGAALRPDLAVGLAMMAIALTIVAEEWLPVRFGYTIGGAALASLALFSDALAWQTAITATCAAFAWDSVPLVWAIISAAIVSVAVARWARARTMYFLLTWTAVAASFRYLLPPSRRGPEQFTMVTVFVLFAIAATLWSRRATAVAAVLMLCAVVAPAADRSNPAIAPPWSMEPWIWEDDVNTGKAASDLLASYRQHDLPVGAILLDSPWSTAYNNFVFDETRYPDPKGMIAAWRKAGVRTVLWMTHVINTREAKADARGSDEDLFSIGRDRGYFVNDGKPLKWWKGAGGMIDFTNPAAVEWWHRLMDRALSLGIDGWKVDGAAELFALTERKTAKGTLPTQEYLDLYYRDIFHYGQQWKPDFVTMVRSVDIANSMGNDGPHAPLDAAPVTWTGDQRHSWTNKGIDEAARSFFRALDLGYPVVSSDTGGYQSAPGGIPRLLYLRWAQWNALTPFFVIGGHGDHRPWTFDPETLRTFRRYMWLHHELVPFFYSKSVQAHQREGTLLSRGPGANEYLLGDELLAGVMLNEKPEAEIVFPPGEWLDYWDNARAYRGGEKRVVAVPEDRSPLFVRRGSIIPLNVENDAAGHGDAKSRGWRTLDLYPAGTATRTILWDTASFPPRADRDRTVIECIPAPGGVTVKATGGPARDTVVRVLIDGKRREARVRGLVSITIK